MCVCNNNGIFWLNHIKAGCKNNSCDVNMLLTYYSVPFYIILVLLIPLFIHLLSISTVDYSYSDYVIKGLLVTLVCLQYLHISKT